MKYQHLIAVLAIFAVAACGRPDFGTTGADSTVVDTDVDRETPAGDETTGSANEGGGDNSAAGANNDDGQNAPPENDPAFGGVNAGNFPFAAYRALAAQGRSVVLAPHGLARSLVVTHAAAGPDEAAAVAAVTEPYLEGQLYDSFNGSDLDFEAREMPESFEMVGGVWADESVAVESDFVDTVKRYTGLELRLLDFASAPEDARIAINNWHSTQSEGRISEVIGPRAVQPATRFVITDATWFSATWGFGGFDPDATDYRVFHGTESDVQLPMMSTQSTLLHVDGPDFQAVVMPFAEGFSMVAVLPEDLDAFEQQLEPGLLDRLVDEATPTVMNLSFPRIEVSDRVALSTVAESLGLGLLFADGAEYTGFADGTQLDDAHQRTRISFGEDGVEATAGVGDEDANSESPPADPSEAIDVTFDKPFFFAIRDAESGTYLFLGRVGQP